MNYSQFMKTAATGLLVFVGDTWLDNTIRWGTESPYSHTMLVMTDDDGHNVTLCQSTYPLVDCMSPQDFWYNYTCANDIAHPAHPKKECYDRIDFYVDTTASNASRYKQVAEAEIGVRYNLVGLIGTGLYRAALYRFFGIKSPAIEPDPKDGFTCSGYARYVWKQAAQVALPEDLDIGMATPYSVSSHMTYAGHLDTAAIKVNPKAVEKPFKADRVTLSDSTTVCRDLASLVAYDDKAPLPQFNQACALQLSYPRHGLFASGNHTTTELIDYVASARIVLLNLHRGIQAFLNQIKQSSFLSAMEVASLCHLGQLAWEQLNQLDFSDVNPSPLVC